MFTMTSENPFLRAFEAFEKSHAGDAEWLRRFRRDAFTRYEQAGFPSIRNEDWKYTNPAPIARADLHVAAPGPLPSAAEVDALSLGALAPTRLVFVDGAYAPALSTVGPLPAGAVVGGLAAALAGPAAERIRTALYDRAGDERHVFAALNAAFTADGAYVYVPRGVALTEPVHLVFVATAAGAAMAHTRVVAVLESGAAATLIEHHVSRGEGKTFTNAVTELQVEANAELRYVQLQRHAPTTQFVATLDAAVAKDGRFNATAISLGAALARNAFDISLMGEGAHAKLDGLTLTSGHQHVDYHTAIIHARPHGTSRELFKNIAAGSSTSVFNGRVVVPPDSQKTDSAQSNHSLLLSREATINAKPQLEIFADDVKCAHGTTVGQLDEQAVFYLRARGLSETEARAMLTHAFAADVLASLPTEALREALNQVTAEWFPAVEKP